MSTNGSQRLRECPFCGGEASLVKTNHEVWISCEHYHYKTHIVSIRANTEAEAIAAWNTRAERTCHNTQSDFDFMCSECHACIDNGRLQRFNYCPRCGAKITEVSE